MFQWVNPKGWLFAVGAASTYLQGTVPGPSFQAATFGAVFFVVAFPSGFVWLVLGALVHRLLRDDRATHIFNVVMGVALAASVAVMLE